ncbi:MAG: histone deacetylase [Methanosarcinales archaeon]|nr:MAG: histone deacetylase [Methanosarcinales archaeon]
MSRTGVVYHDDYLKHETGEHPEQKERLIAIMKLLKETGALKKLTRIAPKKATTEQIGYVHDASYIENVRGLCQSGRGMLDSDTILSQDSYEVALLASGGVMSAVDVVIDDLNNAFALIRPPGHHAEASQGMGFCIFNNVAIAARYAQRQHKLKRILIVDWDVHHGNGTQHIFYDDASVLYFSIHQSPFYPGTGKTDEIGTGDGKGFTVNVPLPRGMGDAGYTYVFNEILIPIALEFRPELVLISAGQDAHFADPIGGMNVTAKGFDQLAGIVKSIANSTCEGRIVAALEGGYDLTALPYSVLSILNSFGDLGMDIKEPMATPKDELSGQVRERVKEVKEAQKECWPIS